MNFQNNPVIIGAIGGSGTRVFARIMNHAGVFMGNHLNVNEDSEAFVDFYEGWVNLYLHCKGHLPDTIQHKIQDDFNKHIEQHLKGIPNLQSRWGMKHPRSIYMMKFWNDHFPQVKFIHVVRNGLDMAYSKNQGQFIRFKTFILNSEDFKGSESLKKIRFWSKVNQLAANFGENYMQNRYLRINYEDLCNNPNQIVKQIFDFVEAPNPSKIDNAVAEVSSSKTIGRWREKPTIEIFNLMNAGRLGLEGFDYWNDSNWQKIERATQAPRWKRYLFQNIDMKHLDAQ